MEEDSEQSFIEKQNRRLQRLLDNFNVLTPDEVNKLLEEEAKI